MDIRGFLEANNADDSREALIDILTRYTQPAFGALPKRETDILIFEVMRTLGLLPEDASVYDLMTDLRITRAKASQLLFDTAIRKFDENPALLDAKVVEALCNARFHHDADKYFVLEVEDPMVNANLKEKVRKAGHISDSSFNSALIRLPLDAVADLVADLLPEDRQDDVKAALVAAGAPEEPSFKNVVKSSLKTLGKKVVGEAADGLVEEAGEFLAPILRDGAAIAAKWLPVLGNGDDDGDDNGGGVLV
ncbi:hypothetical protein [Celeribacter neptunius]|uniref:Uncharacterized protein n=1 Tax=Celeribacter neptunius TaxID=588602 RepID=A0A1I3XZX4_9RHOB|nr:hypothetical protein [Celeribacter neptunius]SFK25085.1 hypothetical protein SAMN04487991_4219 [Celeribacter neptunius]